MSHPFKITDQLIDDTLTTALEGGITYWAANATPSHWPEAESKMFPGEAPYASEVLTLGADLLVTLHREFDDPEVYRLTKAKMTKGIREFCKLRGITPARLEDDAADASDADAIVQLALFGEIVYG